MKRLPYRSCCKRAAIRAFDKGEFYLVSCDNCQTLFSITDDLDLLIDQIIAYNTNGRDRVHAFDLVQYNHRPIFMLP
jgi:hypothetical protein